MKDFLTYVKKDKETQVVLYSISQDHTHIESMEELITNNISEVITGRKNDYKIVGHCRNFHEALAYSETFKMKFSPKYQVKDNSEKEVE